MVVHSPARYRSLAVRAFLRRIALDSRPIVVGPFRSELGFEILYWLPFLHWALKRYEIDPERCLALSRGGMGACYPAKHQIDLYELRTVDQVRLENQYDAEQRKMLKQMAATPWDAAVMKDAVTLAFGKGTKAHWLHPSWMYWLFEPVWEEREPMPFLARHTHFAGLPRIDFKDLGLPQNFVAVKFYERFTFPFQDQIAQIVREMVAAIASRHPVVLLNQGHFTDDHTDLPIQGPNIFALPPAPPAQNLLVQGAVLQRAQAYVGTYGGVAQWALRYGRPSVSFYTQFQGTLFSHLTLSHILSARMNVPFEVCDLRVTKLHEALFAPVAPRPAPSEAGAVPA